MRTRLVVGNLVVLAILAFAFFTGPLPSRWEPSGTPEQIITASPPVMSKARQTIS